jgi:exonuclease III
VYGPQGDAEKLRFLEELRNVRQLFGESWLVIGDFNMILQAQDLELEELSLYGRKFIWSNNTTQTRIDRALCNVDWDS